MTTVNVNLSDELKARLEAKAAESGFDGVAAYIEALLEADTQQQIVEDEDLEQLLLRRVDSEGQIELTEQFVDQFNAQVAQRRRNGGATA